MVRKNEEVPQNQGPEEEIEPEFFDFTTITRRTRSMHDAKLVLECGSNKGQCTALGGIALVQCNNQSNKGKEGPTLLRVGRVRPGSTDLIGFPTKEPGPSTVPVAWPEKGTQAKLDLQYLLQLYPFPIPKGQRAFIPMELKNTAKLGAGVVFKFSQATFALITSRTAARKSDEGEATTQSKRKSRKKKQAEAQNPAAAKPEPQKPENQKPEIQKPDVQNPEPKGA